MKTTAKLLIVAALAGAVVAAVALKNSDRTTPRTTPAASTAEGTAEQAPQTGPLPRLVDLGADRCIPCKAMAPILAEFQRDYADQFVTEFIDVWKNPDAGRQYGVEMIPTQIFFDAEGNELFRHVGFYGKEDMLNKWKELGVEIRSPLAAAD